MPPPLPHRQRLGEGGREILMSFSKSPPLKTLELIYDIVISQVRALFVPQPPPPPDPFGEGGRVFVEKY